MADVHDRLRAWWNEDSETYDRSPSHAASDPVEAAAWRAALRRLLPDPPATVLDVGAGTGAMTLLAAELGYRVTALDIAEDMLARARRKADARGLDVEFVVGPSDEPPRRAFDAVMERHVLWTTPRPIDALAAWRDAAPTGRLVLFEGVWGRRDVAQRARDAAIAALQRVYRIPHDHHAEYETEILAELPLARLPSAAPLLQAVSDGGWRAARVERLYDVEWAQRLQAPLGLAWLESTPRFAVVADA
jgi:ubiquinone/menaquinone biosynthesis C-methylase UbiE